MGGTLGRGMGTEEGALGLRAWAPPQGHAAGRSCSLSHSQAPPSCRHLYSGGPTGWENIYTGYCSCSSGLPMAPPLLRPSCPGRCCLPGSELPCWGGAGAAVSLVLWLRAWSQVGRRSSRPPPRLGTSLPYLTSLLQPCLCHPGLPAHGWCLFTSTHLRTLQTPARLSQAALNPLMPPAPWPWPLFPWLWVA